MFHWQAWGITSSDDCVSDQEHTHLVDDKVLDQTVEHQVSTEGDNRPSNIGIVLGLDTWMVDEMTGKLTNVNVFSFSLSLERMERMTEGRSAGPPGTTSAGRRHSGVCTPRPGHSPSCKVPDCPPSSPWPWSGDSTVTPSS